MDTSKKIIAAYVKSCSADIKTSVEQQKKQILKLLSEHKKGEIRIYSDEIIKNTNKITRTGIFSLLDDIVAVKVKECWVLSVNDIIFDGELGKQILKEFATAKLPIFSFQDSQETVKNSIMQIITTSAAAQKSNTTKLRSLDKGKAPAGRAAFGYERIKTDTDKTTKLVIHPVQSEIVKRIFNEYINHKSMAKVAEILCKENIPAPAGNNWSRASVAWILKNEIYIGIVKYANKKRKGEHTALIDPKTFEQVQKLRDKNRRTSKTSPLSEGKYTYKKKPTEVSLKILQEALELDDNIIEPDEINTRTMTPTEIKKRIKEDNKHIKK